MPNTMEATGKRGIKPRNVKNFNQELVLSVFRSHRILSITQTSQLTRLSKTTIAKIFARLLESQMIIHDGYGSSTSEGGKKPEIFRLNPEYSYSLVISIMRPQLLECAAIDFCGEIVMDIDRNMDQVTDYDAWIEAMAELAKELRNKLALPEQKLSGIAIVGDGLIDTVRGVMIQSAFHEWKREKHVVRDFIKRLDFSTNVVLDNCCRFSGYAEFSHLETQQTNKLIIVWGKDHLLGFCMLSSEGFINMQGGISGGCGHILVDTVSDMECKCGRKGCLQSLLSQEALLDYISKIGHLYTDSPIYEKSQRGTLSYYDVFYYANENDRFALLLMNHIVHYFSILIYNVFLLHSAQKVVLQGVFSTIGNYFLDQLTEQVLNFNNLHLLGKTDIEYSRFSQGNETDLNVPYLMGAAMYLFDLYLAGQND